VLGAFAIGFWGSGLCSLRRRPDDTAYAAERAKDAGVLALASA
jgi:hypothetical protein